MNNTKTKSSTCVIATRAASSSDISFLECVLFRHAALTVRRSGFDLNRGVINATNIEANDGEENSATLAKYLKAKNPVYSTFSPPRPHSQVLFRFKPIGNQSDSPWNNWLGVERTCTAPKLVRSLR